MCREGIIASGAADDAIRFFVENEDKDGLVCCDTFILNSDAWFSWKAKTCPRFYVTIGMDGHSSSLLSIKVVPKFFLIFINS